jgi:Na+/proline symporter
MITYLFIGALVSVFFDWVLSKIPKKELKFTNWERLLILFIWPMAIIWATYGFFKNKNNNDKGN